ncbi:MAG TPA: hypothetical protein VG476_11900 [Acidimicrobiales bacterium]|nr:hypothetical protein [Acidimicrobiales bacterium]
MSSNPVSTVVGVDEVQGAVRSIVTLAEPDYVDVFTLSTPLAEERPAEEWARAVLERSALARRNARRLWRLMGLRLGPRSSPDHVQGWKISGRSADWLRVETASWYMSAQAVFLVERGQVSISLSLRYDNPVARLVWGVVSGPHQRAVPVMLRQAVGVLDPIEAEEMSSSESGVLGRNT